MTDTNKALAEHFDMHPPPRHRSQSETPTEPRFEFSLDGRYLNSTFVPLIKKLKLPRLRLRTEDIDGVYEREYVRIRVRGVEYYAAVYSGTLYDVETGQCLTGRARILL